MNSFLSVRSVAIHCAASGKRDWVHQTDHFFVRPIHCLRSPADMLSMSMTLVSGAQVGWRYRPARLLTFQAVQGESLVPHRGDRFTNCLFMRGEKRRCFCFPSLLPVSDDGCCTGIFKATPIRTNRCRCRPTGVPVSWLKNAEEVLAKWISRASQFARAESRVPHECGRRLRPFSVDDDGLGVVLLHGDLPKLVRRLFVQSQAHQIFQ